MSHLPVERFRGSDISHTIAILDPAHPAPEIIVAPTRAHREAVSHWSANLRALRLTQPRLEAEIGRMPADWNWTFGRDGSLTARDGAGAWWAGCSLPRRAAQSILKSLDAAGRVACFLSPPYAAQLRAALDMLLAEQAIVALCPDPPTLRLILSCDDFSTDIAAHRLWFVWGEDWRAQMERLFDENPGLPTPAQFIRGAAADKGVTDALIPAAQSAFSSVGARRAEKIAAVRRGWSPACRATPRICLMAPSRFRLWDDGGDALARTLQDVPPSEIHFVRFDSDDPRTASPLALAQVATGCDAVVSVGISRSDLPDVLPNELPWITWIVGRRIPPRVRDADRDALMLCDPSWRPDAIAAGWQADQLLTAEWPSTSPPPYPANANTIALIADTLKLEAPPRVTDFSSQHLLWDAIAAELLEDPFLATPNPLAYLTARLGDFQIPEEGFDRELFLQRLIVPAFQQGLARLLIRQNISLRVFGAGWQKLDEFAPLHPESMPSRDRLAEVVAEASALVYAWPFPHAHPVDAVGRPVLRPATGRARFVQSARCAVGKRLPAPGRTAQTLDAPLVAGAIRHLLGR